MIHEISPHTFDNAFRRCRARPDDTALFFHRGSIFLPPAGDARRAFPALKDYPAEARALLAQGKTEAGTDTLDTPGETAPCVYLFSLDGAPFFLLRAAEPEQAEEAARILTRRAGWTTHEQNCFRTWEETHLAFAGITARHIALWLENRAFCGRCGAKTLPSETERAVVCPACSLTVYPEIMPAVIVAVTDGDKLLMVRNARSSSAYKHYALVAGYTEIGESFEQTAVREVMEETGLRIKNLRYFGNQPWGFSNSQMVAFFAELDGPAEITLQESELTEAAWFSRQDIPLPPYTTSIGNEMIRRFKENNVRFP